MWPELPVFRLLVTFGRDYSSQEQGGSVLSIHVPSPAAAPGTLRLLWGCLTGRTLPLPLSTMEHRWAGVSCPYSVAPEFRVETRLDCITLCPAHHRTSSNHCLCPPPDLCPCSLCLKHPLPSSTLPSSPTPLHCLSREAALPRSLPRLQSSFHGQCRWATCHSTLLLPGSLSAQCPHTWGSDLFMAGL